MLELLVLKPPLKSVFESYISKLYRLPPNTSRNKTKVSGTVSLTSQEILDILVAYSFLLRLRQIQHAFHKKLLLDTMSV